MGNSQLLYSTAEGGMRASVDMDTDVMPGSLKSALEVACRNYAAVADSPAETRAERRELARRSGAVAMVFRDMAAVPGLEWWVKVALSTAAEAYEQQAQDWNTPVPWRTGSGRHQGEQHGGAGDGGR